jgi:ABC-type transport system substrate-binding protein
MRSAVLCLATAATACSPERGPLFQPAGNPAPRGGGVLRHASKEAVLTLDPAMAYDEVSHHVLHALFDTLVDYEPSVPGDLARGLALVPRLAERWSISPDGLAYTFVLRQGVVYSDGTPIVAADVAYALERALRLAESPFGTFLADVEGAADVQAGAASRCRGIVVSSERELVIRLAQPNAAFLYVLAMPFTAPQRRAHVEQAGPQLRRRPLGAGPFELERWDEGQALVLRRNPRYWDPARVHLDGIVLRENVPRETQFMLFERGELDTAERLSAPDLVWVTSHPGWAPHVHRRPLMNVFGARMNVRQPPFDDRRVRQALNYALDKQHSLKLLGGSAIPAHGMLIPGIAGRDDTLAPYPHDPARARALLAEAGYPNGFEVEYVIPADEEAERLAISLRADLAAVGVRVRITRMAFSTYAAAVGNATGPAFVQVGWLADFPDPSAFFDAQFHSRAIADTNSGNYSFYANPELDDLLDAARREPDAAARAGMYRRVERILYDDAPWLWDYHQAITEVIQPYVAGYTPHPVWLRDYTSTWLDVGPDGPVRR